MNVWRISGSRMIRNIRCLDLRPLMSGGGKNSSAAPARCVSFFRKARTTAEPDKEDSAEKTLDLNKRVSKEVQRRQGGDDDSFLPAAKRTDFDVAALSARG
jgi:hypothetical protein